MACHRVEGGDLRVEEVSVPESAVAASTTLGSLEVDKIPRTMLLAICRAHTEDFEFKPDPDTPVEKGMTLLIMADSKGRSQLEERLQAL